MYLFSKCFFSLLYVSFHVKKKNKTTGFLCQLSFFLFVFKHSVFQLLQATKKQKFHTVWLNVDSDHTESGHSPQPLTDKGALQPLPAPLRIKQPFLKGYSALNLSWTFHIQIAKQPLLCGMSYVSDIVLVILSDDILCTFM